MGAAKAKTTHIDVTEQDLEDLLARISSKNIPADDLELIEGMGKTILYLSQIIQRGSMTIKRLQKIIFGENSEKAKDVLPPEGEGNNDNENKDDGDTENKDDDGIENKEKEELGYDSDGDSTNKKKPRGGNGRNGVDAYTGAEKKSHKCEHLQSGDLCPKCQRGKVYNVKPEVLIRVTGSAPVTATRHELEKFRCNTCLSIFTAKLPEEVHDEKYDSKSIATVALLHYGMGMPFYRLAKLQSSVGVPFPDSTQWDQLEQKSVAFFPAYKHLLDEAAQGKLFHNDDTGAKILEFMGERREKKPPDDRPDRTGMYTTGIISKCEQFKIAIYSTGRYHAGENLAALLQRRKSELAIPIQMCDGLKHNSPNGIELFLANCMSHSRRKFVEAINSFPEECRYFILKVAKIYHHDAITRRKNMTDQQRLHYHQEHSSQIVSDLKKWMDDSIEKHTEDYSGLGEAIHYALKRWEHLTLFLRKPGAPLDNNICERALKRSILLRKNSLFYKTQKGAMIGDIYMSFIHTCELSKVNPFEFITAILDNSQAVKANPSEWMPWNFEKNLKS
jgi:transposase